MTLNLFRIVAILEGISYLILLLIAMPLKYIGGIPEVVKYVGWAHGVLFVGFVVLLLQVWYTLRWSFVTAALAFIASLVPFGTFILDAKLLKKEAEVSQ